MKKLLFLFLVIFSLAGTVSFAETLESEADFALPKTYIESEIEFFGITVDDEIESRLVAGWETLDSKIYVNDLDISVDDCADLYRKALFENPLLYYVDTGFRYGYIGDKVVYYIPVYNETDTAVINDTIAGIHAETEEILLYVNGNMSDFEKVMAVHDYMVLNYEYDITYSNYTSTIMVTKTGVCMSYALAFNHVMEQLGIPCAYVSSQEMNHAWNLVKIDGEWYHIDLTQDDPISNKFAQVRHTYALLSTEAIQIAENPHTGFDLGAAVADSTLYDDADWHSTYGAVVYYDGVNYWNSGTELVNDKGEVIFSGLAGADGRWHIDKDHAFLSTYGAGLAEHNGKLYFNSDTAIYTYNPRTKEVKKFADEAYLCGLFIDENTLKYSRYDFSDQIIKQAGSIKLDDEKIGEPYYEENKVIVKLYKETVDKMLAISFGSDQSQVVEVDGIGVKKVELDAMDEQTLFFIKENLAPIIWKRFMSK